MGFVVGQNRGAGAGPQHVGAGEARAPCHAARHTHAGVPAHAMGLAHGACFITRCAAEPRRTAVWRVPVCTTLASSRSPSLSSSGGGKAPPRAGRQKVGRQGQGRSRGQSTCPTRWPLAHLQPPLALQAAMQAVRLRAGTRLPMSPPRNRMSGTGTSQPAGERAGEGNESPVGGSVCPA